jgi:putative SOS response-associated peptidase YedK
MCGRYTLTVNQDELMQRFELERAEIAHAPRYNVAPTQPVAVVFNDSPKTLSAARWGLIPAWSRSAPSSNPLINARAETLLEKPSFRGLLKNRRCWVLCDGFYEWRKNPDGTTTPYRATLSDGGVFALAGLWDEWISPDGGALRTCTVVTTEANETLAPLHHRMAVILARAYETNWLMETDSKKLLPLLKPYPADETRAYPVSKLVNSVSRNVPELIVPVEVEPHQASLF